MTNVLHVGAHYDQFRGGGNLRNVELFKELSKICNVYVIAYIENKDNKDRNLSSKHSFSLLTYESNFIKQLILVLKLIYSNKIDVIHIHNLRLAVALKLLLPFKKLVIEFHGIKEFEGFRGKLSSFVMNNLDGFIVLSSSLKDYLYTKYGVSKNKIEYVVNGYTLDAIPDLCTHKLEDTAELRIAYIGTLHDWQGVLIFSDVIESILSKSSINRKIVFNFIGNGNSTVFDKLSKQLKRYIEDGLVAFYGEIAPADIHKYWESEHIIVMPRPSTVSTETIIPLKLIDALKYGKLIVASDVGGLTELLTNNDNAIIYEKSNILDFEEKLKFAIENYNELQFLRVNARKTSENLPSWKTQASRVALFYKGL